MLVNSDGELPDPVPRFAASLSKLAGGHAVDGGVPVNIRIQFHDDCDEQWNRISGACVAPTAGVLTELPPHPSIKTAVSKDGSMVGLRWAGAGIIHGLRGGNFIDLICERKGPDASWMIRYILATVLVLRGDIDVCHGCLVDWNGKKILLCGPSGSGKSSLSLLFALSGGDILTEDITYLNGAGQAAPSSAREAMTLRPGTLAAFNAGLAAQLGDGYAQAVTGTGGRGGIRINISPLFAAGEPHPVAVDLIVFPSLDGAPGEITVTDVKKGGSLNGRIFQQDCPAMINWVGLFMSPALSYTTTGAIAGSTRAVRLRVSLDYHRRFEALVGALGLQGATRA